MDVNNLVYADGPNKGQKASVEAGDYRILYADAATLRTYTGITETVTLEATDSGGSAPSTPDTSGTPSTSATPDTPDTSASPETPATPDEDGGSSGGCNAAGLGGLAMMSLGALAFALKGKDKK